MNPPGALLTGWYDYRLVALSVFIAILAAYAALDLAGRVTSSRGALRQLWLFGGASALGLGIWSMHYIGMLAYHLPVPVVYDWPTVLISLLAAIAASAVALFVVSRRSMSWRATILGSIIMGIGIASMHYIGMEAMRLPAMCQYSPGLVILSIVLAIVISLVALRLTFALRGHTQSWGLWKTLAAIVMGAAIPVMHYVGMAAASFMPMTLDASRLHHSIQISALGTVGITLVTLMVLSIVFITSIVDRRFAEQALALVSSEDRYRHIVDTSFDAFIAADARGAISDWNQQAVNTFGWSRAEAIGKPIAEIIPYGGSRNDAEIQLQQVFSSDEDSPVLQSRIETNARHKDGYNFPAELTISALNYGKSRIYAVFIRDVTQRKAIEQEREKAKEAAEAASRAKGEFLANMSHEIRTPLNGIMGMTELALETELTREQREYLETVKLSADSLLIVINDILDFSKVEAGRVELESMDFNLNDNLESTLKTLSLRADEKGIELLCEIDPEVPEMVRGDYGRLRQVIVNLVGNAIKFTSHGEVHVSVKMQEKLADAYMLEFLVSDTGIGISPAKLETIFEPFMQADTSTTRKYGGTGLGLSISSKLIEMMGGHVWVESELGRGTKFHFTVRLLPAELTAFGKSPSIPAETLRDVRVLVVDDNRTNRRILEGILTNWGMKPTSVESGDAALNAISKAQAFGEPYQLILTDMHMPRMDGFTMIESIRHDPKTSASIIMMLTSGGHRGDTQRCKDLGVAAYLLKPIRQSELRAAITYSLGMAHTEDRPSLITQNTLQSSKEPVMKLNILLVEDNSVNQLLARKMLEKRGHTVTVASDGQQALDTLAVQSFDLVLMDVQMPVMDGLEATTRLRELEKSTGQHQRVVAMTAFAMQGDRDRCISAGMDGYLSKPIKAQELDSILEEQIVSRIDGEASGSSKSREAVNAEELMARIDGDFELLDELLTIFRSDYPNYLRSARESLARGDSAGIRRAAHTLKGALSNLSAEYASQQAADIEYAASTGATPQLGSHIDALEAEIQKAVLALAALKLEKA